jgi:hypothetical protein
VRFECCCCLVCICATYAHCVVLLQAGALQQRVQHSSSTGEDLIRAVTKAAVAVAAADSSSWEDEALPELLG